jgi:hypothetical protein
VTAQTHILISDGASVPNGEYLIWINSEGLVTLSYREHADRAWGAPLVPLGTLMATIVGEDR